MCSFQSHCLTLSVFFIIVAQIDRGKLYCKHVAITKESLKDSSILCLVAGETIMFSTIYQFSLKLMLIYVFLGAVFHYFILNITLWWFFHVCSIFYKIMFPLAVKQYEKKEKYFHIVLLVAGKFHCMRQSYDINYGLNH